MTEISISDLYKLFFTKNLVNVTEYDSVTPLKQTKKQDEGLLTPISKSIYDSVSPLSKPYILRDLLKNTESLEAIETKNEQLDPDYIEKMENSGLGFYMENFISVYGFCPVCGQKTLRKYAQSNIPVVDLICINKEYHITNNKCFIFQVKISMTNEYFSLKNEYLVVGSRIYGEVAHLHKGSESIKNKVVVPGYICIKMSPDPINIQNYLIDYRNSFVLVPDYNNISNKYYYTYLNIKNKYGRNMLTWNTSMVDTLPLKYIFRYNRITYKIFSEEEIKNPYIDLKNKNN